MTGTLASVEILSCMTIFVRPSTGITRFGIMLYNLSNQLCRISVLDNISPLSQNTQNQGVSYGVYTPLCTPEVINQFGRRP
jgi:hypothetical protein